MTEDTLGIRRESLGQAQAELKAILQRALPRPSHLELLSEVQARAVARMRAAQARLLEQLEEPARAHL